MKSRIRALIFSFLSVAVFLPFQAVYADAIDEAIESPCGIALGGDVPLTGGYCDIYQRQIDFMEKSFKFSKSIQARRESYAAPQRRAVERYRVNLVRAYEAQAINADKERALEKREAEREKRREELRKKREAELKKREEDREARRKEKIADNKNSAADEEVADEAADDEAMEDESMDESEE